MAKFAKHSLPLLLSLSLAASAALAVQADAEPKRQPIPVTLEKTDGQYQIYRGGEPYFIRGAGGSDNLPMLASIGGNSIRTWRTGEDTEALLDKAHELGMTVMLGVWLEHERHGFDYDNKDAVAAQKAAVREKVLRFRDHPALLAWGLGNEVDLLYTNTRVWHAVEDIAKMIRELDPNHLITTVVAGFDEEKGELIRRKVPSIDYLSINVYGSLPKLPQALRDAEWEGAYAVTEWGPIGHWEIARTEWDVPIEQTSTEKAATYQHHYREGIKAFPEKNIGSYVFLWGQKQETTPTWYGLFLESGHATEVVDTMQYLWTGEWPEQRAPSIRSFKIDGKTAHDNIYLEAGKTYTVELDAFHPNGKPFAIGWEFLPESTDIRAGGDREARPKEVTGLVVKDNGRGTMRFTAPKSSGPYRLFTYVTNDYNKAATANVPFYVR
jgi:hypothetical protein